MNPQTRNLLLILFGVPLLLIGPVMVLGSSIFQPGTIDFEVHEKGRHGSSIEATIPAAMVPVALHLTPKHVMDEVRHEIHHEVGDHGKTIRALLKEISRCPDGVFIDVQTDTEFVRIQKRDGRIEVTVDTPDELIRASVPLHTVASVFSAI